MSGKSERRIRVPADVLNNPRGYALQSLWTAGRAVVSVLPHLLLDVPRWGKPRRRRGRPMTSTLIALSPDDWAWAARMSADLKVPLSTFLRGIVLIGYKALYEPTTFSISRYDLDRDRPPMDRPAPTLPQAVLEQV